MKKMSYLITLTFTFFAFFTSYEAKKETVTLSKCVDGDTARFIYNGEEIKARFLAIDTPETVHPTKEVEAYGKDASEYTCYMLTNATTIEIEYDSGSDKLDKYNRHLVWVFVDGELLQDKLVSIGYADVKYIYGDYTYTDILYASLEKAKNEKVGLWSDENATEEVDDEKSTSNNNGTSKTTFDINGIEININDDKEIIIIGLVILGAALTAMGSKIKIKKKK